MNFEPRNRAERRWFKKHGLLSRPLATGRSPAFKLLAVFVTSLLLATSAGPISNLAASGAGSVAAAVDDTPFDHLAQELAGAARGIAEFAEPSAEASEYPYPNAPDCNEFGPGGCVADRWNFFQGQCTSWVAWRLNEVNDVDFHNHYGGVRWGNASNWDDAARSLGITVDNTPATGAIAQWDDINHVAYVERINADGSIVMSDQNSDLHNLIRSEFTARPGDYWWPEDFIHISDISALPPRQPAPGVVGKMLWEGRWRTTWSDFPSLLMSTGMGKTRFSFSTAPRARFAFTI